MRLEIWIHRIQVCLSKKGSASQRYQTFSKSGLAWVVQSYSLPKLAQFQLLSRLLSQLACRSKVERNRPLEGFYRALMSWFDCIRYDIRSIIGRVAILIQRLGILRRRSDGITNHSPITDMCWLS